jgi:hypothetical protein
MNDLHLWLDANIHLDLSREAMEDVEYALRTEASNLENDARPFPGPVAKEAAELENAANIIRAYLQHLPPRVVSHEDLIA